MDKFFFFLSSMREESFFVARFADSGNVDVVVVVVKFVDFVSTTIACAFASEDDGKLEDDVDDSVNDDIDIVVVDLLSPELAEIILAGLRGRGSDELGDRGIKGGGIGW